MVKQVRVLRNMAIIFTLFTLNLWLVRDRIFINLRALSTGLITGASYGLFHWWLLLRRITRRDRRYERNKIFVRFLSMFEAAVAFGALGYWFLFAFGLIFLVGMLVDAITGQWLSILTSGFAITASGVIACFVLAYERKNGPLYYQYDNRGWLGREGMLYRTGEVVKPLEPKGKVIIENEIWNAVSQDGENIGVEEMIEVVSMKGLTLFVDRVPDYDE